MGLLQRHPTKGKSASGRSRRSNVRTLQPARRRSTSNVEDGSTVYTDALKQLRRPAALYYQHKVIDHAEKYVDGVRSTRTGWRTTGRSLKRAIQRHVRQRRAVPPVPVSRRAGVPVQRAQRQRRGRGSRRHCATSPDGGSPSSSSSDIQWACKGNRKRQRRGQATEMIRILISVSATSAKRKGPENIRPLFLCGRGGTAYASVFNTERPGRGLWVQIPPPALPQKSAFSHRETTFNLRRRSRRI